MTIATRSALSNAAQDGLRAKAGVVDENLMSGSNNEGTWQALRILVFHSHLLSLV